MKVKDLAIATRNRSIESHVYLDEPTFHNLSGSMPCTRSLASNATSMGLQTCVSG